MKTVLFCFHCQDLVYSNQKICHGKNTSILLGDYFDDFISKQVKTGEFTSASEVVRAALRLYQRSEKRRGIRICKRF